MKEGALARHPRRITSPTGNISEVMTIRKRIKRNRLIIGRIGTKSKDRMRLGMKTHTWKEAFEDALEAAKDGNPRYQTFVGYCYDNGRGVSRDLKKATYWYGKAAKSGAVDAIFNLAVMNAKGLGMRRNPTRAARLFEQAALRGDLQSQANLAVMLLDGDGVKKDIPAGFRWLRRAAQRGDSKAQYNLGRAYTNGEGVRKNVNYAQKWLFKASEGGHKGARKLLQSVKRKVA
jgi:TPR repeat protein